MQGPASQEAHTDRKATPIVAQAVWIEESLKDAPGGVADLVIRTSIEPDAENRSLEIVADSAEFYRSEHDYAGRRARAQDDDGRISQPSTG